MESFSDDLRKATCEALRFGGASIMREPRRFVAFVSDKLGPDSFEMSVLYHTMGVGYLDRLADAAEKGTIAAINDAVMRSTAQLEHEYAMRGDVASCVSLSLGLGVADFWGLDTSGLLPDTNRFDAAVTNDQRRDGVQPAAVPMTSPDTSTQQNDMPQQSSRADAASPQQYKAPDATQDNARTPAARVGSASATATPKKTDKGKSIALVLGVAAMLAAICVARFVAVEFIVPSFLESAQESSDAQADSPSIQKVDNSSSASDTDNTDEDAKDDGAGKSAKEAKDDDKDEPAVEEKPAQSDDSSDKDTPASPEQEEEDSLYPFTDLDALWWGGKTDTGCTICYVENPDTQRAGFMAIKGSAFSWWTGPVEIDGSTVTIRSVRRTGEDDPHTFYITWRGEDSIGVETDDYGSATLPVLSYEQRETVSNAIYNINYA